MFEISEFAGQDDEYKYSTYFVFANGDAGVLTVCGHLVKHAIGSFSDPAGSSIPTRI